jgi:adenylosuccinate synthase
MGATIVVGGQYGSEGKGKVVALTAGLVSEPWVVRCGGPNSGHTVYIAGQPRVLRQVPSAAGMSNALLLLSAGCAIDEALLLQELDQMSVPRERIVVDPRAVLIAAIDREQERGLITRIASTGSGTGSALSRRMARAEDVRLAAESEKLQTRARVQSVAPLLHGHLAKGGEVIIEGTQGFGLSLLHGPHYPHVTSRDTTAAAFASEVGLSPRHVDRVILVVRTYPIRVGGESGPLRGEMTWQDVQRLSGAPEAYPEYTSVTHRLRRVGTFDLLSVKIACAYNCPTELAVMGLDRLDYSNHRIDSASGLTPKAKEFLRTLELQTTTPVGWIGTGFATDDVCVRLPLPRPHDWDNAPKSHRC